MVPRTTVTFTASPTTTTTTSPTSSSSSDLSSVCQISLAWEDRLNYLEPLEGNRLLTVADFYFPAQFFDMDSHPNRIPPDRNRRGQDRYRRTD